MIYTAFKFEAVIDWIEIEIRLCRTSKGDLIHAWTGTYAEPINKGAGGAASVFRLRLQEPRNWQHVKTWIEEVEQAIQKNNHCLAAPTSIPGIEIAFDVRMRHDVLDQQGHLAEIAAHLYCSLGNTVSDNHRYPGNKGTHGMTREVTGREENIAEEMFLGRTLDIGNKWDMESQRIYVKSSDQKSSTRCLLPRKDHRARLEIALIDHPATPTTLEGWKAFDFATLATTYFTFRQRKPGWTTYREAEFGALALVQYGALPQGMRETREKSRRYSHKPKRGFPLWTAPDAVLNKIAKRQLDRLTNRMACEE